jgi:hypothetical protein
MNDTLLESEFSDFLKAAVDFVGGVPEFALRFNLDPSVIHKILRGQLRPRPCLLAALKIQEVTTYRLPANGAAWWARHKSQAVSDHDEGG